MTTGESPQTTSDLLEEIAELEGDDRISLGDIADVVGSRAHGLILLALSLPETIPMVGLSAILAAPIFVLGVVLTLRGEDPPVPGWVRRRTLPRDKMQGAIKRTRRVVKWLDRISRPRWNRMARAGCVQGVLCVLMAIILAIPIPGINLVAAASVAALGLGILQRDGAAVSVAVVLGIAAIAGFAFVVSGSWSMVTGFFGG
jgi:hypothetical protein